MSTDRKNANTHEANLAMMAEMQRIEQDLHTLGDEMLKRVNALLRAEAKNAQPHPDTEEPSEREQRRA